MRSWKGWLLSFLVVFVLGVGASYAETVKIIAEDDWYPYSANRDNKAEGIAVDIVKAAFESEGITVEYDVMNYDRGMAAVKDGSAIACFDTPRTKEIEDLYLWHNPRLFSADSYFYVKSDYSSQIQGINDLTGKVLGLTQGYGYGDAIDTNNNINKEYSKSDDIITKKLVAGRVDVIVLYDKVAEYLVNKLGVAGQIKIAGPSESTDLYAAFSKKHPDGKKYCDILSQGLAKIKEDGTYQKIMDDWTAKLKGTAVAETKAEEPKAE